MAKWEVKKIKDFLNINPPIKLYKDKEYTFIDIDKVVAEKKTVSNREHRLYAGQSCSKFLNGDTLFSRITPCLENRKIAKAKLENEYGFGSTEFYVFRAKENISDENFVYYLVSSDYIVLPAINSMSGASGRQRASKTFIENLKIKLPDLSTQKRIADILSAYDDLIENNNKRIELLEKSAQELYKEWFIRFRFPNYQNTKFVNGLPEGWEVERIGGLFKTSSGGTPSRKKAIYYENGQIEWVKTGELNDRFILETEEKITNEAVLSSSAKLFPANSLILAMYGATIGKMGFVLKASTCNQACCVFSSIKQVSNEFLYFWLFFNREYIINISFGAAQQNLSQEIIKNLKMTIPNRLLLIEFDKFAKPILNNIASLMQQNQNLIKQRDLLLPRLLSGKLEV